MCLHVRVSYVVRLDVRGTTVVGLFRVTSVAPDRGSCSVAVIESYTEQSMKDTEVFDKITTVLRDVFDDDQVVATADLTASKVDGWDSLGNVRLFLALEKAFAVRFSATEIGSLKNVGQLADLIELKTQRIVS